MVGKKVLLSPPPSLSPLARETISSFFYGTMSMERRNSSFKGGKRDVFTITDDDLK